MKDKIKIALAIISIPIIVGLIPFLNNYIDQKNSLKEIKNMISDQRSSAKRRLDNPDYRDESTLPEMRSQIEKLKSLTNITKGKDKIVLDVILEYVDESELITSQYESVIEKSSKVLEFGDIRSPNDITESIEKVKKVESEIIRMSEFLENSGRKIKDNLDKRNLTQSYIQTVMEGFYKTSDLDRKIEFQELNLKIWKEIENILKILKREWGEWEYSEEEGKVLFDSEKTFMKVNDSTDRIEKLTVKSEQLQLEILESQSRVDDSQ